MARLSRRQARASALHPQRRPSASVAWHPSPDAAAALRRAAPAGGQRAGEPAAGRRWALVWQRQSERFAHPRHVVVEDAIWVYRRGADGAVGAEAAGASFSHSGTGGSESVLALGDGHSLLVRLVRDGAATATGVFGRRAWRPGGRPHLYPSRLTVTTPIVDNVLAMEIPRPERDAYPDRTIFRAANGTVVGTDPPIDW